MPCVLQNATHSELGKWWDSNASKFALAALFIRYKCGFVPIGVFPALIANLAGNKSVEMKTEGIKKNRVEFQIVSGDYDRFTLISQPKYYAVHITRRPTPKTPTHEICATVRGLGRVHSGHRHLPNELQLLCRLSAGFRVPLPPGKLEGAPVCGQQ